MKLPSFRGILGALIQPEPAPKLHPIVPTSDTAPERPSEFISADGNLRALPEVNRDLVRSIRHQMVRLQNLVPIAPEDERALVRFGSTLQAALALMDRVQSFELGQQASVYERVGEDLSCLLAELEPRVRERARGTVHEVQGMAGYATAGEV